MKIFAFYALLATFWSSKAAISHAINHLQLIWCVRPRHNLNVMINRTPQSMIRRVRKNAFSDISTELISYSLFSSDCDSYLLFCEETIHKCVENVSRIRQQQAPSHWHVSSVLWLHLPIYAQYVKWNERGIQTMSSVIRSSAIYLVFKTSRNTKDNSSHHSSEQRSSYLFFKHINKP